MPERLRHLLALLLLALLCGGAGPAWAADDDEKKEKPQEEKLSFQVPIPIGHKAHGIRLPDYNRDGTLQMNFEIGTAHRRSETEMEMVNLRIETFNEENRPEMVIELARSLLDLKTRILFSSEPVTIRRGEMEVKGANMTFDTRTREGKFTGPVRVLIYNRDEFETPNQKDQ